MRNEKHRPHGGLVIDGAAMSLISTKQTSQCAQTMSALEGKADADSHYGNHAQIANTPASHDRPVKASPLSTIGRKRMAKTLASSLPIITLGIKRGCTALIATSRTISTSQVSNRIGQIGCWIE